MSKYILGKYEAELCKLLKKIIVDKDDFVATMLFLTAGRPDPEMNCKQLIDFIKNNPNVDYEMILNKTDEILGIEEPFED